MTQYTLKKVTSKGNDVALYRVTEPMTVIENKKTYLYLLRDHDELLITDHQMTRDEIRNFGDKLILINGMKEIDVECKWQERDDFIKSIMQSNMNVK